MNYKIFTLISIFFVCSFQYVQSKKPDSSKPSVYEISETLEIDSVWAANLAKFDLFTSGNYQFVAYYNRDRMMTVASREINSKKWQKTVLTSKLLWDTHRTVVISVDKLGYVHVSGNMHNNKLVYYRSSKPLDISNMLEIKSMTGEDETSVTYPKFIHDKNNNLYYLYRSGSSGNGNVLINKFIPEELKWVRHLTQPIFKGLVGSTDRSAYSEYYQDSEGYFHFIWVWRWTAMVETCHQLSYAKSYDFIHWENCAGEAIELPLVPDNEKLIVDNAPTKGGMHNGKNKLFLTPDNKPIIGYIKYDEKGLTQLFLAKITNGKWMTNQISNWNFRWKFIDSGDLMTSGASFEFKGLTDDGLLIITWKTEEKKAGEFVVDTSTLTIANKNITINQKLPSNINSRINKNLTLNVNLASEDNNIIDGKTIYMLKWETLNRSHGKNAPKIIPTEPISKLLLLKLTRN